MDVSDAAGPCEAFVTSNSAAVLTEAVKILATLLSNLAKEDNAKFRRVNLQNAKIKAAIGADKAKHAIEVLTSAGFESVEDGAALEHKAENASARCAATLAALDAACSKAERAPFALRLALPHGGAGVRACAYAADGATILTGATDNIIRVWPSAPPLQGDAVPCAVLAAHGGRERVNGVMALKALPGGEVASGGRDGKVCVWDASDCAGKGSPQPAPLATFTAHGDGRGKDVTNKGTVIDLAHDGATGTLLSCGWDHTARAWPARPADGTVPSVEAAAVLMHQQAVLALATLSDGRLVTGAGDGSMTLWRREAGGAGAYHEDGTCRVTTPVRGLAPLADGGFGQVGNDGVLRVYTSAAALVHTSPSSNSYLFCVAALEPVAARLLAAGGDDGVVIFRILCALRARPGTDRSARTGDRAATGTGSHTYASPTPAPAPACGGGADRERHQSVQHHAGAALLSTWSATRWVDRSAMRWRISLRLGASHRWP